MMSLRTRTIEGLYKRLSSYAVAVPSPSSSTLFNFQPSFQTYQSCNSSHLCSPSFLSSPPSPPSPNRPPTPQPQTVPPSFPSQSQTFNGSIAPTTSTASPTPQIRTARQARHPNHPATDPPTRYLSTSSIPTPERALAVKGAIRVACLLGRSQMGAITSVGTRRF
jgi:hypothetical protein